MKFYRIYNKFCKKWYFIRKNSCLRVRVASRAPPVSHRWIREHLNGPQFMLQSFIKFHRILQNTSSLGKTRIYSFFPIPAIPVYLQEVLNIDMPPNRHWYCCLLIYTFISSFLVSCYLLIIMTFERFYSIIKPHKAASFNTFKRARIIIVIIFVSGFSFSIPYFFIVDNIGNFCVPNQFASDNGLGELYYWLTEIFIFIFPFLSLLIMNSIIIYTFRER